MRFPVQQKLGVRGHSGHEVKPEIVNCAGAFAGFIVGDKKYVILIVFQSHVHGSEAQGGISSPVRHQVVVYADIGVGDKARKTFL